MKKIITISLLLLFLPLISSEIIINQQPDAIYNLGDVITVPTTVKSPKSVAGFFQMDLICSGIQENFYKNGVSLSPGEEKKIEASLVLTKSVIGEMKGNCTIKAFLGNDFSLTNNFKISDSIAIKTTFEIVEFNPGETITLLGQALKENGKAVNGLIELSIIEDNSSRISQAGTINNGAFSISLSLPENIKAGNYLIKLNAYEQDIDSQTTNNGFLNQNILVKQVPTSLEIVFDSSEVQPGTSLRVKAVLHDQTGEKIQSLTFLSIKNRNNKILEQVEIETDQFYEFPVEYNELPSSWKVVAVSNKLTSEANFTILEKEAIKIEIADKIVTITNMGNVLYNKTALVKIGNQSLNIDVYLEVGKSQKYVLTAPDGSYSIEISTGEENASATNVVLTGKAVDVKKAPGNLGSIIRYPFVWIFIVIILAFAVFIFVSRSSKKSFFGYITSKIPRKHSDSSQGVGQGLNHGYEMVPLTKGSLISSRNKAEISLSIKGDKQDVSVVSLHIKNLKTIQTKSGLEETLQKIVDIAESKKAAIYEDSSSIIFILSPSLTRTFKNEKAALEIAQSAKEILLHHNKMFKQRIEFGISLNHGPVIGSYENHVFKFSSIDTTLSAAKKISSLANEEILLGEKINDKLRSEVKTIKQNKSGIDVYAIKEIKNPEQHAKFIKNFTERYEREHGKR
ncbi:hypothetical protein J4422_03690 [Candidatus Pacearchaeota archaeon]|nr:hypothetical protein [Candidatus Pacearchaeota archaeon]